MDQQELIEIWKQLFEEMRYYTTFFLQITTASLLFLGAFSALIHYVEEAKIAIWIAGFIGVILFSILVCKVGNQQGKAYNAALEIQKRIVPADFKSSINELMKSKKPISSNVVFQASVAILMIIFWIYLGYLTFNSVSLASSEVVPEIWTGC